jgi:pantothenate synthetase
MAVQEAFAAGKRSRASLQASLLETISRHGGLRLQYGDLVDPDTLRPVDPVSPGAVAVVAARCGPTRLIDNHILVA